MYKKGLFFIGIFLAAMTVQAQVAMGKWRTHFAYNSINHITQSENKVFAVSEGSLFSVDKRDGGMELYSKISGLNGTIVGKIAYDKASKTLLITYNDGNIDFLSVNGVKNLPDYYNKQMSVDKAVNHILYAGEKAYLSCNFGIITLNMPKMEIRDTYYIGSNASDVKVLNTAIHKGYIYAVSETDIYFAEVSNPFIINFESWSKMSNLPGSGSFQAMHNFNDELILQRGGKLYRQDAAGNWNVLDTSIDYLGITVSGDYLIGFTTRSSYTFNEQFTKTEITSQSIFKSGIYDAVTSIFWLGSNADGVIKYSTNGEEPQPFKPDGPAVNIPYKMRFAEGRLFVVQGGRWDAQYNRPGIVMIFENNEWKIISDKSITASTNKSVLDFMDVAVDPNDKTHFFVSSYGTGVFEFRNDEFYKWYNVDNSTIESVFPSNYEYMRLDGGVYDKEGNVWFSNSMTLSSIQVLKKDDKWISMSSQLISGTPTLGEIFIPNQNPNQKWILSVRYTPGIVVFDDNGTLESKEDDAYVFHKSLMYSSSEGTKTISPEYYYSIAQDRNGVIWIGTDEGPILVNNPSSVFETSFTCSRIIIPRNDGTGLGDYLLEEQSITAIAIDGANRKWLGTKESGVYLMSENGQETIQHFTTQNSPLLSNEILSIAINPVTGEVFFGTGAGLISYQSDAAESSEYFNDVHVYPNPVRETHSGLITITGLVEDTIVKITDVAGNLVCETKSNGSIATWDGKNKFGQKVSTGVYLAICVTSDGEQSFTAKILVVN